MIPATLSDRTIFIFEFLSRIADAGGQTPTNERIRAAMAEAGYHVHSRTSDGRSDVIGYELAKLYKAGLMAVIGAQQNRVFEVIGTGARTDRRKAILVGVVTAAIDREQKRREQSAGWPKVTAESARPYDQAVMRRLFARHELRPPAKEAPRVHATQRAMAEPRSFVGCSAAMAVAS